MANEDVAVARGYHERTKHSEERLRASPHYLDWDNQPIPFKLYRDLETIPLPRQLEPGTVSALRAISALVGRESEPTEQVPGLGALARVLYYSAGITKVRRSPGGGVYFRAASNTGALYHVDLYLACRDLPDLPAGQGLCGNQPYERDLESPTAQAVRVAVSPLKPSGLRQFQSAVSGGHCTVARAVTLVAR